MPSNSGSHGRGFSARSSASVAGLANTTMAMKVRPHSPINDALCANGSGAASA